MSDCKKENEVSLPVLSCEIESGRINCKEVIERFRTQMWRVNGFMNSLAGLKGIIVIHLHVSPHELDGDVKDVHFGKTLCCVGQSSLCVQTFGFSVAAAV